NTITTEEFIKNAYKVHKNKYEYSKVKYKGYNKKVTIICKEHGEFSQTAGHHIRGCGCPDCANKKYKGYGGSSELKYLAEKLRNRLRIFRNKKNMNKDYKTQEILGCSWLELKE